jgi:two-component system, LytTR family, response regulator
MKPLRVIIADDEAMARKRMTRLAGAIPGVAVVGECTDGQEVLDLVAEEPADVLLLDIQMPGLSGLDASALLPDDGPVVIFTTAHPEHALRAFDIGATDYLLKPIDAARLQKALQRVRRQLTVAPPKSDVPKALDRVALPTRRGVRLVAPPALYCALFDGTAVTVETAEGEKIYVDMTLAELEQRLPDPPFVRTHRRALVNLDAVEELEDIDTGGYLARLQGGRRVAVSRAVARELRRRLGLR